MPIRSQYLSLVVFLSSLIWLMEGYSFGNGNHGQEIPPILAMIDPSLYTSDFAVQDFTQPGPRFIYYFLLSQISLMSGLEIDIVLLLLKIACHLLFFGGIVAICSTIVAAASETNTQSFRNVFLVSGLVSIAFTVQLSSWGSSIFDPRMVPSTLAMAIAIWALFFALIGRWIRAFAISGFAILFQFLVGLYAGLVLLPGLVAAFFNGTRQRRLIICVVAWILPAMVVYAMSLTSDQPTPGSFSFLHTFGDFRVPHHWLPSTGGARVWISDGLLFIGSILAATLIWRARPDLRDLCLLLSGMVVTATAGVLANVFFVEFFRVDFVGKLQFQRIMPFGHVAAYILATLLILVFMALRPGSKSRAMPWNVVCTLLLFAPSLSLGALFSWQSNWRSVAGIVLAVVGVLIFAILGKRHRIMLSVSTALLLAIANLPIMATLPKVGPFLGARFAAVDTEQWRDIEIYRTLREDTPIDSLVIIPPDFTTVSNILALETRRNVYFSFKNVPYSEHGVWEWSNRGENLLGTRMEPDIRGQLRRIWAERDFEDISRIAGKVGACFLVDRIDDRDDVGAQPLVVSELDGGEVWGLWRLGHCSDDA